MAPVNESAPGHSGDIRGLQLALLAYAVVFAAKLAAYFAENARFLPGRAPGAEFMAALRQTTLSVPGVLAINDVRPELSVAEAAGIAGEVERRVHTGMQFAHCFVQAEPAAALPR